MRDCKRMRVTIFLAIAALVVCAKAYEEKKIVCYFSNWSVYRPGKGQFNIHDIQPELCTHLVYSYAGLTINGEVKSLDPYADLPNAGGKDGFNQFNKLRLRNSRVKTFIAIGGWSESSAVYSAVAADPSKRWAFVQNAIGFVKNYGFDGMSFDWQYPNQRGGVPTDKVNYVQLLKELREGFDRAGLLLMATVGAVYHSADQSYNIPEMVKYLDTINLMTFDFHGPWESQTGFNSPLYKGREEMGLNQLLNVNETLNYWLNRGAPAHKLVMGIPAYGRSWTLKNPHVNGIGAPAVGPGLPGPYTRQPGFLGHNEIVEFLPGCTKGYNSDQMAWYAIKSDQWFSFEETWTYSTIRPKGEVIKNLGLGGAMLYNIDTDDFLGISGDKFPLLKAINRELKGYGPVVPSETSGRIIDPCDLVCREAGHLRDRDDCTVYYRCVPNGSSFTRYRFNCTGGLVFDLKLELCNWPYQVNCNGCKL